MVTTARRNVILYAGWIMFCKRFIAATILFGAISWCSFGQNVSAGLQKELIRADRGIWEAMSGSHPDMERVDKALAVDYLDVDSGVRHARDETLEYVRGLTKFSFQYRNARAYLLSPTSGYVIAELSYSSVQNGNAAAGQVLTTTVFSKENGHWVAHLHTEMDLKPEKR